MSLGKNSQTYSPRPQLEEHRVDRWWQTWRGVRWAGKFLGKNLGINSLIKGNSFDSPHPITINEDPGITMNLR